MSLFKRLTCRYIFHCHAWQWTGNQHVHRFEDPRVCRRCGESR